MVNHRILDDKTYTLAVVKAAQLTKQCSKRRTLADVVTRRELQDTLPTVESFYVPNPNDWSACTVTGVPFSDTVLSALLSAMASLTSIKDVSHKVPSMINAIIVEAHTRGFSNLAQIVVPGKYSMLAFEVVDGMKTPNGCLGVDTKKSICDTLTTTSFAQVHWPHGGAPTKKVYSDTRATDIFFWRDPRMTVEEFCITVVFGNSRSRLNYSTIAVVDRSNVGQYCERGLFDGATRPATVSEFMCGRKSGSLDPIDVINAMPFMQGKVFFDYAVEDYQSMDDDLLWRGLSPLDDWEATNLWQ